jgi:hypothetical protein
MCVYESESERGEREGSTRKNNFVHGKLLAGIHGAAICNVERGGGGKRRKSRVLFLVGSGCLIQCFSLYFFWCDNPRCLILIGGHKGASLHQLLIEVILF